MWIFDWAWLVTAAGFAARPTGPMAAITLFVWLFHLAKGRPRLQIVTTYVAAAFAGRALFIGGLAKDTLLTSPTMSTVATWLIAVGIALSLVMQWLLPVGAQLPQPRGPWEVACTSVHLQNPQHNTNVMVRVYFPTRARTVDGEAPVRLPYFFNETATAAAFAFFAKVPSILFTWMTYIHSVVWDAHPDTAPLPDPTPLEEVLARLQKKAAAQKAAGKAGGAKVAPAAGADDGAPIAPRQWPVMVFSHGLGGLPDCYSLVIAEIVSQGWVVFAPEHADGSAALTVFPDNFEQRYIPLAPEALKTDAAGRALAYKTRHRQLLQRAGEVRGVIDLVYSVAGVTGYETITAPKMEHRHTDLDNAAAAAAAAAGGGDGAAAAGGAGAAASASASGGGDLKQRGGKAATAPTPVAAAAAAAGKDKDKEKDDMQLLRYFLEDRLDVSRLVVGGHSFGAATSLTVAEQDKRPVAVVALDVWMFPLAASTLRNGLAHVPVLSVCGDEFTAWKENATALKLLLSKTHRASFYAEASSKAAAASSTSAGSGGSSVDADAAGMQLAEGGEGAVPSAHFKGASSPADAAHASAAPLASPSTAGKKQPHPRADKAAASASDDLIAMISAENVRKASRNPFPGTGAAAGGGEGDASGSGAHLRLPDNGVGKGGVLHDSYTQPGGLAHPRVHPSTALLSLNGVEHQNFNDFAIIAKSLFGALKLIGRTEPKRALRTITDLTTAFMEQATSGLPLAGAAAGGRTPGKAAPAATGSGGGETPHHNAREFEFTIPGHLREGEDFTVSAWTVAQATEAEKAQ